MIKINIISNGKDVLDNFESDKTTLAENSIVLRRLEEIKLKLLSFQYENKLLVEKKKK